MALGFDREAAVLPCESLHGQRNILGLPRRHDAAGLERGFGLGPVGGFGRVVGCSAREGDLVREEMREKGTLKGRVKQIRLESWGRHDKVDNRTVDRQLQIIRERRGAKELRCRGLCTRLTHEGMDSIVNGDMIRRSSYKISTFIRTTHAHDAPDDQDILL